MYNEKMADKYINLKTIMESPMRQFVRIHTGETNPEDWVISGADIMRIPTTDVQPVVHGRWIPMTYIRELTENGWPNCRWEKAIEPDSVDGLMCSECGEIFDVADARNFCTQCGSDMRQRSIK